jgi:hypothetical protein
MIHFKEMSERPKESYFSIEFVKNGNDRSTVKGTKTQKFEKGIL